MVYILGEQKIIFLLFLTKAFSHDLSASITAQKLHVNSPQTWVPWTWCRYCSVRVAAALYFSFKLLLFWPSLVTSHILSISFTAGSQSFSASANLHSTFTHLRSTLLHIELRLSIFGASEKRRALLEKMPTTWWCLWVTECRQLFAAEYQRKFRDSVNLSIYFLNFWNRWKAAA